MTLIKQVFSTVCLTFKSGNLNCLVKCFTAHCIYKENYDMLHLLNCSNYSWLYHLVARYLSRKWISQKKGTAKFVISLIKNNSKTLIFIPTISTKFVEGLIGTPCTAFDCYSQCKNDILTAKNLVQQFKPSLFLNIN